MKATAPFYLRSQYLAGGVNTGNGWSTWNADGAFVPMYVRESQAEGMVSVFDYYMLLQSLPAAGSDESAKDLSNLSDVRTMTAFYMDLKLFFLRAAAFGGPGVVLHFEPDLWGYIEQHASGDDAATVPAQVAATGLPELAGLADDAAGFAQAVLRLRDQYAPGEQGAYLLGVWGTGNDVLYSKPADSVVDALAGRAAAFYRSLGANFDVKRFSHVVEYDEKSGGLHSYLQADSAQDVTFAQSGTHIHFEKGERIHTESAYKYSLDGIGEMARASGMNVARTWQDEARRFSVNLLVRAS